MPFTSPPPSHEQGTPDTPRLSALHGRIEAIVERLRPWSWLWPPAAFAAGLASFFLVDRQQWLGALLALGMLAAWLLLLSESLIGRLLARRGYPTLPHGVTLFIAQMIHQETLFFTLPFLLATTVWSTGQTLFTLLLIALAIFSIIDPLYYRVADRFRWLYFAFHAQCVFLVVLVTLPIMLQLTTGESLKLALGAMLVFSLPSLLHLTARQRGRRWLMVLCLLPLLAGLAWVGRIWVPPANLWLSSAALSPAFDAAARSPQGELRLTPEALSDSGLYAYTAIRAPRGLREEVFHVWRHEGQEVDRIALTIEGGREAGYRAWSRKQNLPDDPSGRWRIDVMTDSGQRIGVLRFDVGEGEAGTLADGRELLTGLQGLGLRSLVPGRRDEGTSAAPEPGHEETPAEANGARASE